MAVLLVMVSFSGCSDMSGNNVAANISISNKNNINAVNNSSASQNGNNLSKRDYINSKYLFRVSYPKEWGEAVESETQDGALLYYKNDNDVRIFADKAGNGYLESQRVQAENEDEKVSSVTSNDGLKGIIITGSSKDKKLMHVVFVYNGNHYDFYALATEKFYKDNESYFIEIAKSLKTLSS